MRKICGKCNERPAAVNYYKDGKAFYRSMCDHCARGFHSGKPNWNRHGYKKKLQCDKCGFKSNYTEVFDVVYLDGNATNILPNNLKTVCANCQRILAKDGRWKQGDLRPDF